MELKISGATHLHIQRRLRAYAECCEDVSRKLGGKTVTKSFNVLIVDNVLLKKRYKEKQLNKILHFSSM